MEGKKHDDGKLRFDLIPPEAELALATVMTIGAAEYGEENWSKGMDWSRVYAATRRHLYSWWTGEEKDPKTGLSHLWHALTNVAFLVAYEVRNAGNDNRKDHAPCRRISGVGTIRNLDGLLGLAVREACRDESGQPPDLSKFCSDLRAVQDSLVATGGIQE